MRTDWGHVLDEGRGVVANYDTPVTLRQLFYRLVAAGLLSNTTSAYKGLSPRHRQPHITTGTFRDSRTAPPRRSSRDRRGTLPPDRARHADYQSRLDRTARQAHQVWLGVEKATMLTRNSDAWYGDRGLPVHSAARLTRRESYVEDVAEAVVAADGQPRCCCTGGLGPLRRGHPPRLERRAPATRSPLWSASRSPPSRSVGPALPEAPGKDTDPRRRLRSPSRATGAGGTGGARPERARAASTTTRRPLLGRVPHTTGCWPTKPATAHTSSEVGAMNGVPKPIRVGRVTHHVGEWFAQDDPRLGVSVDGSVLIDGFDGWIFRYVASLRPYPGIVRLVIEPRGDDPPGLINADFFRNIPLRDVCDLIAAVYPTAPPPSSSWHQPNDARRPKHRGHVRASTSSRQRWPRPHLLRATRGPVRRGSAQVGYPSPTADLIRELDLPDRTVRYYLARARALGLFDQPAEG